MSPNARILNLGCGVGIEAQELALAGYTNVYPWDINEQLLRLGQFSFPFFPLWLPSSIRCNFSFLCYLFGVPSGAGSGLRAVVDAQKIPASSGSFDVVLLKDLLLALDSDHIEQVIEEAIRVLGSGGLLVIQNEINPTNSPVYPTSPRLDISPLKAMLSDRGLSIIHVNLTHDLSKWRGAPTPQIFIAASR